MKRLLSRLRFWKHSRMRWGDGTVFMERLTLLKTPLFSVKIHCFRKSDEDLHDHPWPFISLIIKGQYFEHRKDGSCVWRGWMSLRFHRAEYVHKVAVWETIYGPAWALCVTFRREREWGFWIPQPDGSLQWMAHDDHQRIQGRSKVTT